MEDSTINTTKIVKQSSTKYTQEEVENAIRGSILRLNEQIDKLSKEREAEFKQILNKIYNEIIGELK